MILVDYNFNLNNDEGRPWATSVGKEEIRGAAGFQGQGKMIRFESRPRILDRPGGFSPRMGGG